jgi:serine/threonine protein kinase
MKELVGQSLDRYKITSLLGEGGMGAVLKARDVTLQRDVAVKVMHPQFARRPDFRERFLQEARTAARLDNPGIVKVYDFGQAQTHLYIVMEFISGENLRQMLKDLKASNQWLFLPEAIQLIRQVCLALDYAHKQGVLHRDIKPDNIMLKLQPSDDLPYQPVVTDLGLAKLAEGGMMTADGTSMGTPAYMSPEQALGEKTDARSDVYSLGILLYELTAGQLPFRVRTLTEAIRCHTKEPPPPPRSLRPDLPEGLERIILKAIAKDPADRYANAKALSDALAAIEPQSRIPSVPPTAAGGGMSLMTHHQQSLVSERGASILDEFRSVPSDLAQDRIQILDPDKTTRSITIRERSLTIGRGADNDLVLDRPSISRHHARIEFDGTKYQVIDQDSTNGTFVANVKLLPGVPETWTPEKPMRIGDTWLRLERAQQPSYAGTAMYRPNGSIVEPSMIHTSRGMGRVGVFIEPGELAVDPGGSTTTSLTILNQGSVVDHFQTSVTGVPAEWVPASPQPVRLMPGAQEMVTITIQPPRAPATRAGNYPLAIRVASQDAPSEISEVKRTLTVSAYSQFTSDLHPQRLRPGKAARLTVNNQGNLQQTFNLTWQDRAAELVFEPPQAQLSVPEGQSAAAEFRASSRERPLFGSGKQHPFTAQVTSPKGETQTHSGEVVSGARFPVWILPALLALCICLAAAGALGARYVPDILGGVTPIADAPITPETPITPGVAGDVDSDGDGLSDSEEERQGTYTDNADSDNDGLTDGEEVNGWQSGGNTYRTDPTDNDSDDDGLLDGEERDAETHPYLPDTDGDGQVDGQDSEPGVPPSDQPDTPPEEVPFEVTGVIAHVSPSSLAGECPTTISPAADITVSAGGEVTFRWETGEGETIEEGRITFSEAGSQTVQTEWTLTDTGNHSMLLHILTPTEMESNEVRFELTCEAAEVSIRLTSNAELDGYVVFEVGRKTDGNIRAGNYRDTPGERVYRGFMSFDLSDIPAGATIQDSTLVFYQMEVEGNPYEKLGSPYVEQGSLQLGPVYYGNTLSNLAFSQPAGGELVLPPKPSAEVWYKVKDQTLTDWIQQALDRGQPVFQLRLQFTNETDEDFMPDYVGIESGNNFYHEGNVPELSITYLP